MKSEILCHLLYFGRFLVYLQPRNKFIFLLTLFFNTEISFPIEVTLNFFIKLMNFLTLGSLIRKQCSSERMALKQVCVVHIYYFHSPHTQNNIINTCSNSNKNMF